MAVWEAHGPAVEADFHRFYGLDIRALFDANQWRKLGNLVKHLPPESATAQAITGRPYWSTESYLLAALFDATQVGNWQRGGGKKASKPKPLKRPSKAVTAATPDVREIDRLLSLPREEITD